MPTIRFTNRLDRHVDCPQEKVAGETVLDALRSYFATHDKIEGYVLDESEKLRTHMRLDVDDAGEFLAVGSSTGGLFCSRDGGHAWKCVSSHLPHIYSVQIG